jgi:hypothetical protein
MSTTDFSQLKKTRQSNFDKLTTELSKLNAPQGGGEDNRFWRPDVDKAGNGYAVIRFLPAPAGEDIPFVRIWDHGFQGPGGWYIEKSLTTLGQKDPVSEYNTQLWNNGTESGKEQVRKQKRRLTYVSNVYVIKDTANPQNEGKVFLFKYGKKIWDKLSLAMNPEFEDEAPLNPFDLWEGANFKVKIRNVEGYRNYDKSEFDKRAPLFDDDGEMEAVWKSEHKLSEFIDPSNFKSYDELKEKLYRVLGLAGNQAKANTRAESSAPWDEEVQSPKNLKSAAPATAPQTSSDLDDDDDSMDFFKKLAAED